MFDTKKIKFSSIHDLSRLTDRQTEFRSVSHAISNHDNNLALSHAWGRKYLFLYSNNLLDSNSDLFIYLFYLV